MQSNQFGVMLGELRDQIGDEAASCLNGCVQLQTLGQLGRILAIAIPFSPELNRRGFTLGIEYLNRPTRQSLSQGIHYLWTVRYPQYTPQFREIEIPRHRRHHQRLGETEIIRRTPSLSCK